MIDEGEEGLVYEMVKRVVDGWGNILVRVRQDGKRMYLPLSRVKDQRQLYKLVKDLLKQAAKENGL